MCAILLRRGPRAACDRDQPVLINHGHNRDHNALLLRVHDASRRLRSAHVRLFLDRRPTRRSVCRRRVRVRSVDRRTTAGVRQFPNGRRRS